MKIGIMIGFALGAAATAALVTNVNMAKIYKKGRRSVMHGLSEMMNR